MQDKQTVRNISKDIEEALKAIAEKHNLALTYKGVRYTGTTIVPKIEFFSKDSSSAESKEAHDWNIFHRLYNLPKEWLGQKTEDGRMTIIGISRSKRKYPIIMEDAKGNHYKTSPDDIKRRMGEEVGTQ